MSGEGIHVPTHEGAQGAPARPEGPVDLGSPAPPPGGKKFFLVEYVEEILRGIRWLRATPKPEQTTVKRVQKGFLRWSRGRKSRLGAVAVIGIIVISYMLFANAAATMPTLPPIIPPGGGPGENTGMWEAQGTVSENGQSEQMATLETRSFAHMTVVLTWADEPPSSPARRNAPDNLGLNITAPNGVDSWELPPVSNGQLSWKLEKVGVDLGEGAWTIIVLGGPMGDEEPITGRPCILCQADNANAYALDVDYSW